MTLNDRLRFHLQALEQSAPDDLPPTTWHRRRSAWVRLAPIGGVAIAAMVLAAGAVYLLDGRSTGTDPSDLKWSAVQFANSGVLDSITVLNGKLFIAGADEEGPAIWTSEDGLGWGRSSIANRSRANHAADFLSMGIVSGHGNDLIAVGHRAVTQGGTSSWQSALWTSDDGGKNWVDALESSLPQGTLDVVAMDAGYVALGQGPNGIPAVWTSLTGLDWTLATDALTFRDASIGSLAAHDGLIVAVGARTSQAGPNPAMAWLSHDGVEWMPIVLSGDDSGNATDVIATDSGFVAVGSKIGVVTGAVAWRSSDGLAWQEVVLHRGSDMGAGFVASLGDGFLAIGGKLLELTTGRTAWSILSPSAPAIPLEFDGQVAGIVGFRDRYVGIGGAGCGLFGECSPHLFWGLPPGANQYVRLGGN